eukprot:scaffold194284_cov27-Tisochrysis_lutea.AAC.4
MIPPLCNGLLAHRRTPRRRLSAINDPARLIGTRGGTWREEDEEREGKVEREEREALYECDAWLGGRACAENAASHEAPRSEFDHDTQRECSVAPPRTSRVPIQTHEQTPPPPPPPPPRIAPHCLFFY